MVHLDSTEIASWHRQILLLEAEGKVTRTFRRLDPDRQFAVIEALLAEAAEVGPQAVSVKRVAARAGVAVGSLYQYFARRDGMLDFAAQACVGFLTECLDGYRPVMATLPLREGLLAYLGGGVEWSRAYAGLLSFFVRAAYQGLPAYADSMVRPVARSMRGLLAALIEAAGQRGELRAGVDVDTVTRLVHAFTIILADPALVPHLNDYVLLFDTGHQPEAIFEAGVDFIMNAIGSRREGTDHG
ncbi:MAG: TetR/AcrR family transcriptional regulator [Dactylosporangium sp.]|nr:TetR/AcrR family transcriptional regulator [Dactylosporangium sp.]NNJ60453.1 TetR/AcrR family transcriptional regulator [Dactylosporangium sp.]